MLFLSNRRLFMGKYKIKSTITISKSYSNKLYLILCICIFTSCNQKEKLNLNEVGRKVIYYEQSFCTLDENHCSNIPDTNVWKTIYRADIIIDSTNNIRKILSFDYKNDTIQNSNEVVSNVRIFRVDKTGLWRIIYSKEEKMWTERPYLRIDTEQPVQWFFPDATARNLFSTEYTYLDRDTLVRNVNQEKIPVYIFDFRYIEDYPENSKVYLDENFNVVKEIMDDYSSGYYYRLNKVESQSVPKRFVELMNNIFEEVK